MAPPSSFAHQLTDTIVAVASAPGEGARAIVRLSGPRSFPTLAALLAAPGSEGRGGPRPATPDDLTTVSPASLGPTPLLLHPEPYTVLQADLELPGWEVTLPALAYLMPGPLSYTRQDVAELHLVGSPPVVMGVLSACLEQGARLAHPGEFTRRALLAGRIDLAQAEALLKLVDAPEEQAARAALRELTGALGGRLRALADRLFELVTHLEVAIDFSQEDVELVTAEHVAQVLDAARAEVDALLSGSRQSLLQDRPTVLLFGRANVGKSSLFNRLLGRSAALVTDHPGTTRDPVEATLALDDLQLRLLDGAGQQSNLTGLDARAADRTRDLLAHADLVLHLVDTSQPISQEDRQLALLAVGRPRTWVTSKADLPCRLDSDRLTELTGGEEPVAVSSVTGEGLEELRGAVRTHFLSGCVAAGSADFLLSVRQREALGGAASALGAAASSWERALGEEFVAADVWDALEALGQVTGQRTGEDVLEAIFSRFCIGK